MREDGKRGKTLVLVFCTGCNARTFCFRKRCLTCMEYGIGIVCLSGATSLPADCCPRKLAI